MPNINNTYTHVPSRNSKYMAICYRQPGLLSQTAFADLIKLHWCIIVLVGSLGSTNHKWWGVRLLPMSILTYPVDCVHLCHLLRAQHHCLCPNGRELQLAHPPPPPCSCPTHLLIHDAHDITGVVKNNFKSQQ